MREAAKYSQITWEEFTELPGTTQVANLLGLNNSQCAVIAHYRMTSLFEQVMIDLRRRHPEKT
jgi:hypothetical protein